MLTLPIKKRWFDMILSGEKKEEYRNVTDYYTTRFRNVWGYPSYWGEPHPVRFRNGYSKTAPSFIAICTLSIRTGNSNWGAEPNIKYYVLKIQDIEAERKEE